MTLRPASLVHVLMLLLLAAAGVGHAGSFRVEPAIAEVDPASAVASFQVHNSGTEVLRVQVQALAWSQGAAGEQKLPAAGVTVSPRIATVEPGQTQQVRVALRDPQRDREVAFRVQFVEMPGPVAAVAGTRGVRSLLRVDVPLFFAAANAEPLVEWAASITAEGTLLLHGRNRGGQYLRGNALRILDQRSGLLAERKGPLYVLGGKENSWALTTHGRLSPGDQVRLQLENGGLALEHALTIQ